MDLTTCVAPSQAAGKTSLNIIVYWWQARIMLARCRWQIFRAHSHGGLSMTSLRTKVVTATASGALALALLSQSAQAHVASINGQYDTAQYDTPDLVVDASGATFDFTNVQLTLHGYQGLNNGITQSTPLPDITAGSTYTYIWNGAFTAGNLFAFDYDDTYGGTGYTNPDCVVGSFYCALVGNFDVTFTALYNGLPVFSQFSPATNVTGSFVGWEGLNPDGLSETTYDQHNNGGPNGVLAYIDFGTPSNGVPEPGSLSLLGACFAALGLFRRRKA
jgi:PEP-CTERM motif